MAFSTVSLQAVDIFWSSYDSGQIFSQSLDTPSSPSTVLSGLSEPQGIQVVGDKIYWVNQNSNFIGVADLDGSNVNTSFIPIRQDTLGLLYHDGYLYWTNRGVNDSEYSPTVSSIGRAKIDGTDVNQDFIAETYFSQGLATDGDYLYWGSTALGSIGRANLDGTNATNAYISASSYISDVHVYNDQLYWLASDPSGFSGGGSVGVVDLDGDNYNTLVNNLDNFCISLFVYDDTIYWTEEVNQVISASNLDGTVVDRNFIEPASGTPTRLYVVPELAAT